MPPFFCDQEVCRCLQFFSKTALGRHHTLGNNFRKRVSTDAGDSLHVCTVQGCQKAFNTQYQLQKHKDLEGHKVKRGRKSLAVDS